MLFGPRNSIIPPFDYLNPNSFEDFENQLSAIQEHYRFSKLSQLVGAIRKKKRQGFAALVLENPRKGVFLHAVPVLLSREIPFTLFVDPDYVGLNRLPIKEELKAYRQSYPDNFSETEFQHWCERSRKNPTEVDLFLKDCRKRLGPLKVDELDSLRFPTTWGKLLDLPPKLVEFGIQVNHELQTKEEWEDKLRFFENQLKNRPSVIRAPKEGFSERELEIIQTSGGEAVLGHDVYEVTQTSSVFNLPIWELLVM